MITIILENSKTELDRFRFERGDEILINDDNLRFPLLSELSLYSYDVFSSKQMEQLISELNDIKENIIKNNFKDDIEAIILLAKKCSKNKNYTLTFTPFLG